MQFLSKTVTYVTVSLNCSKVLWDEGSLLSLFNQRKNWVRIRSDCRYFCLNKHLLTGQKYTVELLPEMKNLLENGYLKHRKHLGVQKIAPIILPEALINAASKLIPKENEKFFMSEAEALWKVLVHRRLPIEKDEINQRLKKLYPSYTEQLGTILENQTSETKDIFRKIMLALQNAHNTGGEFEDIPQAFTKEELDKIKNKLRKELKRWSPVEYDHHNSLAYLVGRLAANYASAFKVFYELKNRACDFEPKTFFDFGSGVGSAVWAAHAVWGNSLKEYFCVDASSDMNDISQQLLIDSETEEMLIKTVYHRQFLPASETIKYDLVVSAFSLMDLPSLKDRLQIIDTLWRKTNDFLIIIEYGNNAGFLSVLDARDYILQVENTIYNFLGYSSPGAHVIAPCPHDSTCPRLTECSYKPCGFTVPYQPLFPTGVEHLSQKDWISYVILRKGHRPETDISWPRIVKPVLKRPKHVHCRLCCSDGKLHEIIVTKARHGRHAYRCARSSTLGDLLPVHLKPLPDRDEETEDSSHVNNDEIDTESNKT